MIVLPGRSNAGKSTLVHALVEAGASYFSDEYAVLDAEGDVWPYPRRLALRAGPFGESRRAHHVTALREPPAARIGLVALLAFAKDTGWDVDAITPAQAVFGLCDNTVAIQRRPKDTLEYLARAVEGAVAIRGARGEARDAARRILHGCLGCRLWPGPRSGEWLPWLPRDGASTNNSWSEQVATLGQTSGARGPDL